MRVSRVIGSVRVEECDWDTVHGLVKSSRLFLS
jgi:hypothetical protein